jgi:hypothetical protein
MASAKRKQVLHFKTSVERQHNLLVTGLCVGALTGAALAALFWVVMLDARIIETLAAVAISAGSGSLLGRLLVRSLRIESFEVPTIDRSYVGAHAPDIGAR